MPAGDLRDELVDRLRALHAVKAGALRLFDPMLASVADARDGGGLTEVSDLLDRMHRNFGSHREATANHVGRLATRLEELGEGPARGRIAVLGAGAALRARSSALGGLDFGSAATEAFVFEHLEIAKAHLLEQLADRAGDGRTATVVREIRTEDEAMAATIGRNWTNVLSLSLAVKRLPVRRPEEAS